MAGRAAAAATAATAAEAAAARAAVVAAARESVAAGTAKAADLTRFAAKELSKVEALTAQKAAGPLSELEQRMLDSYRKNFHRLITSRNNTLAEVQEAEVALQKALAAPSQAAAAGADTAVDQLFIGAAGGIGAGASVVGSFSSFLLSASLAGAMACKE
jgi:hypothetical protein